MIKDTICASYVTYGTEFQNMFTSKNIYLVAPVSKMCWMEMIKKEIYREA